MVSELVGSAATSGESGSGTASPSLRRKNSDRYRGQRTCGGSVANPYFWEKWPDLEIRAPNLLCRTTQLPFRDVIGSAEVMWTCRLAPLGGLAQNPATGL